MANAIMRFNAFMMAALLLVNMVSGGEIRPPTRPPSPSALIAEDPTPSSSLSSFHDISDKSPPSGKVNSFAKVKPVYP